MSVAGSLPTDDLELVWERLAQAIDAAGAEREALFLAKLAILLADALADRDRTLRLIEAALDDLS